MVSLSISISITFLKGIFLQKSKYKSRKSLFCHCSRLYAFSTIFYKVSVWPNDSKSLSDSVFQILEKLLVSKIAFLIAPHTAP